MQRFQTPPHPPGHSWRFSQLFAWARAGRSQGARSCAAYRNGPAAAPRARGCDPPVQPVRALAAANERGSANPPPARHQGRRFGRPENIQLAPTRQLSAHRTRQINEENG
jgi:hypothetical protein